MKEKLVIASNNGHKIEEIKQALPNFEVLSMKDVGFQDEIDETGATFEENALIKANALTDFLIKKKIKAQVIADDSGLCVNALGGAPGVYSARYGGNHDVEASRKKLLNEMKGKTDRSAYFVCVIVKMKKDKSYEVFEGRTYGKITQKVIGTAGFAFDPLFFSKDLHKTFAEATIEEKNAVSHRGSAVKKLKNSLTG